MDNNILRAIELVCQSYDGIVDTAQGEKGNLDILWFPTIVGVGGELVGLVSDRELRRPGWVDEAPDLAHHYELDDQLQVKDIMIHSVFCVHTYDTLSKAVKLVLEHRIGAVPVKDKTGALVGMLSAVDLLKALDDMIEVSKGVGRVKRQAELRPASTL